MDLNGTLSWVHLTAVEQLVMEKHLCAICDKKTPQMCLQLGAY